MSWEERARCQSGINPEAFYATDPTEAKAWCAGCEVRSECLADALERKDPWGVRGGLDPWERQTVGGPKPLKLIGSKYRDRTHCPQGHPYEGHNLKLGSNGWRQCRTCANARARAYAAAKKSAS